MDNTSLLKTSCSVVLAEGAAPGWIQLMPSGVSLGRDGRGPYILDDAATVAQASMAAAMEIGIPVDYEHQTEFAPKNGQPAPAAGWIKAMEARPDGIWAQVDWTERAAAHIAAREYRAVSPVFYHDVKGHVGRIESVALTNVPNLNLKALNRRDSHPQTVTDQPTDCTMRKTLASMTGLPEGADQAAVEKAVADALSQLETFKTALDSIGKLLKLPSGNVAPEDLEKAVNRAITELDEIKATARASEVEKLVAEALAAGKITPAQQDWAKSLASQNLESLRTYMAATADLRPGAGVVPALGASPETPPTTNTLTPEQKAMCRMTGISPENFLKSIKTTTSIGATA